jgi:dynein heavy chain
MLDEEFKNQNIERSNLMSEIEDCQNKLNRANILMKSLGNEKENWSDATIRLKNEKISLVGDMIIAVSFINYLGPFDGAFRE